MDILPNELYIQIASHLDFDPPSITRFAHEPSTLLTCSDETPLKNLALVSWRWRKVVLPILFRYSAIALDKNPQWVSLDGRLIENMQGHLSTLSNHEFHLYQRMRNKFKSSFGSAFGETFDELLVNLVRIEEEDTFLQSLPRILWLPHLPKSFVGFAQFVSQFSLRHHIESVVVYTDREYELPRVSNADMPLSRAVSEIWTQIFTQLEPSRVVVAAPPRTIAGLLDVHMMSADAWAFDMKMHYLELRQHKNTKIQHLSLFCRPWDSALVHRRPWAHLGYNEGSSIKAYSTYEYHLKQSPKMLFLILARLAKEASNCCNIRSFSFFSVFPFSTNVTSIVKALQKIKTLRRVQFQLAPGRENNLLSTPERLGRAQPRDLWLEWDESYKLIVTYLSLYEFEQGSRFISMDCHGPLATEIDGLMEKLQERGVGWRTIECGIWEMDHSNYKDGESEAMPAT